MPGFETSAERYRRLAREYLTVANTFPPGDQRDAILQTAQVWLRLAHDHSGATLPFSRSSVGEQAAMQQQQQIKPDDLALKRAPASGPSDEWSDDDFDVLADGEVVGRIFNTGVYVARPWMWTLDIGQHKHRSPTHGYAATREAAMTAFAKSWRRE